MMKLRIHSQIGNGWVISSHTLPGMWLLIHVCKKMSQIYIFACTDAPLPIILHNILIIQLLQVDGNLYQRLSESASANVIQRFTVAKCSGKAWQVKAGQVCRFIVSEGPQVRFTLILTVMCVAVVSQGVILLAMSVKLVYLLYYTYIA